MALRRLDVGGITCKKCQNTRKLLIFNVFKHVGVSLIFAIYRLKLHRLNVGE